MPTRRRRTTGSISGPEIISPSNRISPSMREPMIRSFIRLKERKSVLLPQPDGPIIAVILFRGMSMVMSLIATALPYHTDSPRVARTCSGSRRVGGGAGTSAGAFFGVGSARVSETLIVGLMATG